MRDEELFEWLDKCPTQWSLFTDGNGTITITLTEETKEEENN
jgi:hypothetical protein|tara:strand:+ start:1977 stop:2102 length:126 start_codon:yes stop_codon:yes gene_type:complete